MQEGNFLDIFVVEIQYNRENHTHLIKNRLRSRISDINLGRLMCIAIEGPQLTEVNFHQLLDIIYKQRT